MFGPARLAASAASAAAIAFAVLPAERRAGPPPGTTRVITDYDRMVAGPGLVMTRVAGLQTLL